MTRRGGAIMAVLLLMVIGLVVAATVLVTADAAGAAARAGVQRTQSRALAWSGVQGLMAELAEQREDLLAGRAPDITPEWDLYTAEDGTRGVVRLIDLDPDSPAVITPENAKLDINTATAEMLGAVPGLDAQLAQRIVAARDADPFASVGELLGVEGVTPALLYGESAGGTAGGLTELGAGLGTGLGAEFGAELGVEHGPAGGAVQGPGGLWRYLTVFSFDPNVQVGIEDTGDHRGNLRVNLDQSWSEDLGRAIAERFDQDTANVVRSLMESGQTFKNDGELVRVLVDNGLDPQFWPMILDVFTTSDDQFLRGRVDVNTAPAEVLACLPGITPEQASAIVAARESVDPEARLSAAWLVIEGILEPAQFAEAAEWLTTRSTQWRVRLEAGIERGASGEFDESAPMTLDQLLESWDEADEGRLEHRVVLEAVIDVASSRARVAYLRDITMLEPALAIREALAEPEDEGPAPGPEELLAEVSDTAGTAGVGDDPDPFLADSADLDFGDGEEDAEMPPLEDVMDLPGGEAGGTAQTPRPAPDMVDRRIGRWTTRKAGDS